MFLAAQHLCYPCALQMPVHDWHPVASSPQKELLSELFCSFLFPWQFPSQLSSHPTCLNSSSSFECGSCKFISMQGHGLVLQTRGMCCIWQIKLTCLCIKYWLRELHQTLPSWKGEAVLTVAGMWPWVSPAAGLAGRCSLGWWVHPFCTVLRKL